MIDITDWPVIAKLIFVLSPFVVGLPGIMLSVYTTITKDYEIVCSAITSNPYFESVKRAWGGEHSSGDGCWFVPQADWLHSLG
ncbi:hypothetical protein D3C80_1749970 [compost metagenome]